MQAGEAKLLQKRGSVAFLRSLEAPFMPRPKHALVAELNGEDVGCFSYSITNLGKKKLGFCDYLYVDSAHAGKGIASKLCAEGINYMREQGCDYLATSVRDDNVGSWATFEKHGFVRAKTPHMIKALGLMGYLRLSISSMQGIAGYSCDFFMATRPESQPPTSAYKKESGVGQLLLHLLTNLGLLIMPFIVGIILSNIDISYFGSSYFLAFLLSALTIFGGAILFTFIGTLLSKRNWAYRTAIGGGILLSFILSFLGIFIPIAGSWYPAKYEYTPKFKRDMAITAILPWLFLLGLRFIFGRNNSNFDSFDFLDISLLLGVANVFLVLRCIPFHTFNHGSSRVYKYNKILWIVMVVISLAVVFFW